MVSTTAGQPASTQSQNQSLSGWIVRALVSETSRKTANTSSKFPSPMPHQGDALMR